MFSHYVSYSSEGKTTTVSNIWLGAHKLAAQCQQQENRSGAITIPKKLGKKKYVGISATLSIITPFVLLGGTAYLHCVETELNSRQ